MSDQLQPITVLANRSELGVQEPCAFFLGDRRIEVVEVIDRWLASDYGYFKLLTTDGIYILRHDSDQDRWALTLYKQSEFLPVLDVGKKPRIH
ncbi:uncharacterized protein sS8_5585 [Methylocaldum marinum]|uniref:Uncharacterized protein n=1 Tax=Methylocaldum marinum TaxID=1432792 RepID=A0A286P4C6_9GAMM|nr:hypothetical protein [Methylocaldum marinum]BBA37502.1 uncharacterized protein sS8_5585 [Methylocaldum marinum]